MAVGPGCRGHGVVILVHKFIVRSPVQGGKWLIAGCPAIGRDFLRSGCHWRSVSCGSWVFAAAVFVAGGGGEWQLRVMVSGDVGYGRVYGDDVH